jgi:hypothetical protein
LSLTSIISIIKIHIRILTNISRSSRMKIANLQLASTSNNHKFSSAKENSNSRGRLIS